MKTFCKIAFGIFCRQDKILQTILDLQCKKDLFHISTPVGNYTPKRAIAFCEGTVKHIYFIAETKGTMNGQNYKEIERAKISCAEKLFNEVSTENVKYRNCAILWARTDENTNVLPPEFSAEIDALRAGNKRFRLILMRSSDFLYRETKS